MIGAGSVVFSKNLTGDILSYPEFRNATFSYMDVDRERLDYWLKKGAQPSDTVRTLIARHFNPSAKQAPYAKPGAAAVVVEDPHRSETIIMHRPPAVDPHEAKTVVLPPRPAGTK